MNKKHKVITFSEHRWIEHPKYDANKKHKIHEQYKYPEQATCVETNCIPAVKYVIPKVPRSRKLSKIQENPNRFLDRESDAKID